MTLTNRLALLPCLLATLCVGSPLLGSQAAAQHPRVAVFTGSPLGTPACGDFTVKTPPLGLQVPPWHPCVLPPARIASTLTPTLAHSPEQRSRWVTGLTLGFVGGALLGGSIGYALDEDGNDLAPEHAAALGAGLGTLGGALVGTLIGASIRVEQSPERHSRWATGLTLGLLGGALLGGAIGIALDKEGNDTAPALAAAVGASVGTLGGAAVGTLIGASMRGERLGGPHHPR